MRKRTTALVLTLTALVLAATATTAAAKQRYDYAATVTSAPTSTANGYPAPGGTAVMAGTIMSQPFGPGALIDHVTVTGQTSPNVFTFKGTEVDLFADGTQGNTFTGTATVENDGSQSVVVHGQYTHGAKATLFGFGGTGRYANASGSYTFTGTIPAGSNALAGHSSGSIAF
jgi:hypothetical protein